MNKGDVVTIECEGRSVDGVIEMISPNGKALLLTFEANLAGHVGMMPVLRGDDGAYRSVRGSVSLRITPRPI